MGPETKSEKIRESTLRREMQKLQGTLIVKREDLVKSARSFDDEEVSIIHVLYRDLCREAHHVIYIGEQGRRRILKDGDRHVR